MLFLQHTERNAFCEMRVEPGYLHTRYGRLDDDEAAEKVEALPEPQRILHKRARHLQGRGYLIGRHEPEFQWAIRRDPGNPAPYLVYGDWLLEHQDPRGLLILLHARMADEASAPQLSREEAALFETHGEMLVPRHWEGMELEWFMGHIRRVRLSLGQGDYLDPAALRGALQRGLYHPSCIALERISIQGLDLPPPPEAGGPSWRRYAREAALRELAGLVEALGGGLVVEISGANLPPPPPDRPRVTFRPA